MHSPSAACSIHEEGRLKGLILLGTTSWQEWEVFCYDASQETFKKAVSGDIELMRYPTQLSK